ncbi:MAG: restriction endonuclease [Bacteroidales bacterium]|nr:restriction endonuclease [Bacteroidales bacterium]
MSNYDFRNLLSFFEFECFSRDLINAHEGLDLANFAEGRDGGIDLRYTQSKGNTVIVQAKRYKDYAELKSELKKEVTKVKSLNPQRYMITTSVDLTPANKQEIITLFSPYIKNENDIWAKQDLNKYLAQHTEVEQKYYKLWLASTNVLNNILNKNIVNWTGFEKEEIKDTVRTYVMNDSFNDALTKLLENRYVVISGEPGIGKTTLARVIIVHLLSDKFTDKENPTNFEEFYYTNSNIDDFAKVMQTGKRQVFFYDDFLGKIALEQGEKNFDCRIVSFIKACQREKDKLFILATREYILQQGLARYSCFHEGKGIEMSKCVVDMGKYTRFVRAQILYNHLVANEIPQDYINTVLDDKNYLKLIDHPHYSPRIIETFLTNGTHEHCKPEEYFGKIKGFFDHPDSVWLDAFNRLSTIQQEALLVLATMERTVMYDLWKEAYMYFFKRVHHETNYLKETEWNETVKVLQNNFIKIGNDHGKLHVDFHNPGVNDVLTRFISSDNTIRNLLLENAYFIEQAFGAIREDARTRNKAVLPAGLIDRFFEAFDRLWDDYRSCYTALYSNYGNDKYYRHSPQSKAETLFTLVNHEELLKTRPYFVEQKMTQEIMEDEDTDFYSQLALLQRVDIPKTGLDMEALFHSYTMRPFIADECVDFAKAIEKVFPNHEDYLLSKKFCELAAECLKHDLESAKDTDLEELDSKMKELFGFTPWLEDEVVVSDINNRLKEYYDYIDAQAEAYDEEYRHWPDDYPDKEEQEIDNLFATIKERN